ncbi:MAG: hypothetical protein BroJett011_18340 [Chloroflexota bacterium]|nr:MAG: hypothetical protein BroJett011_18340 [Chloroflexota bacterium]
MPTRLDTNFARLTNPDMFESLVRDICALEWGDPHIEKFGRKGQKQYGVDVYGRPVGLGGKYRAAQCKLRTTDESLTQKEIEAEVGEAKQFPHPLDTLLIVTNTPRDSAVQLIVDEINDRESRHNGFRVAIWFWDNITERLATYPKLIVKYYSDYFANLTTLPAVERLVDTPLQLISLKPVSSSANTPLEERLRFRGIRILKQDAAAGSSLHLSEVLPDGLVSYYNLPLSESTDSTLLKFVTALRTHEQHIELACPIFVVLPPHLVKQFLETFELLNGDSSRVQLFSNDLSINEISDRIFKSIFAYGHTRRGSLTTLEISARTLETRPSSALLDLDWRAKLGIDHFPTPQEWEDHFIPALKSVRSQIASLSDRVRVQINSQLPLPAAFALGFFFNLRVARVGVWARKTGVSDFKQQFWLSDGDAAEVTYLPKWVKQPTGSSHSAIVELTSYVDIHKSVEAFVKESGLVADAWLQLYLGDDGKHIINIDEGHAVSYAKQVGQLIRHLNAAGVTDIHLFARIPSALAVLIGQRLQACGRIHLYWFDNPTYRFAFTLE